MLNKKLCKEESLRLVASSKDSTSVSCALKHSSINQSNNIDSTQIKGKRSATQQCGKRQHKVPKEGQKPSPLSSLASKKESQAKSCSPTSEEDRRVFLGGLPVGMREKSLRQQLAVLGYKVEKRPKILRNFAPEVLMRSVEEAKELVELGTIMIQGVKVEVRPFNSLMKQSKSRKIPNISKRSIFLGGLTDGTTAKDIQNVFTKMGIRIVNYPVTKFGFSRQVILETVCQAKALIKKQKILINGTLVDVRPFERQQRRKKNY